MSHTDNKPCIVCNGTKEDRTKPRIADGGHGFYPDCLAGLRSTIADAQASTRSARPEAQGARELLATEKRDLMLPTPEGTEWICAEEPLKEQIQQTLYDPHWRFIVEWQRLAAELGVLGEEMNLYWPKQYVEISVPVSGKALAAAVNNEPYRDGLPPEHLRAVWEAWEERTTWFDGSSCWAFRPLGATWAEVEALAAAAAKPEVSTPNTIDCAALNCLGCPECMPEHYRECKHCSYIRVTVDYGTTGKERVANPECPTHGVKAPKP